MVTLLMHDRGGIAHAFEIGSGADERTIFGGNGSDHKQMSGWKPVFQKIQSCVKSEVSTTADQQFTVYMSDLNSQKRMSHTDVMRGAA